MPSALCCRHLVSCNSGRRRCRNEWLKCQHFDTTHLLLAQIAPHMPGHEYAGSAHNDNSIGHSDTLYAPAFCESYGWALYSRVMHRHSLLQRLCTWMVKSFFSLNSRCLSHDNTPYLSCVCQCSSRHFLVENSLLLIIIPSILCISIVKAHRSIILLTLIELMCNSGSAHASLEAHYATRDKFCLAWTKISCLFDVM